MMTFPGVDPIPLPAPVLFFKILQIAMLTLHFYAVHILLGGMIIGGISALKAKIRSEKDLKTMAELIIGRLPIVMAFVINFAIPPLLFTQVLYGRALFPSTVMIGLWWFAIIILVLLAYYLLYISQKKMKSGKGWWWISMIAYLVAVTVAFIYSNTMTLMLRPEAWTAMYYSHPGGFQLPSGDPTIIPRWIYMLTASIAIGAAALIVLSLKKTISLTVSIKLRRILGYLAALFAPIQVLAGYWVFSSQPEKIRAGLMGSSYTKTAIFLWGVSLLVLFSAGINTAINNQARRYLMPVIMMTAGLVNIFSCVMIRDAIRDITLRLKGFDVWNRSISVNWSVIIFFLLLFIAALVATGWMAAQLFKTRNNKERYGGR
jgi:hypothetical protein